ncbi:hypothetical protein JGS22_013185 [Streptomyces sp. P38-E01]|uniref:Uncharacterized protein n=1 Tax=Streptomyces tardus TaxID=2780544 RepID=A0A949JQU2_9ACTN|nr:hypothetical protein [Streptomyces tardus]MBU7598540.1 hypothetical protein [Streptomyces tardus]
MRTGTPTLESTSAVISTSSRKPSGQLPPGGALVEIGFDLRAVHAGIRGEPPGDRATRPLGRLVLAFS